MNQNNISVENLEKYLSGVLNMELNIYIQEKMINKLTSKYYSLAKPRNITEPKLKRSTLAFMPYIEGVGFVCAVITTIVTFIIGYNRGMRGFFNTINNLFTAIVFGFIALIVGGVVIGSIVAFCVQKKENDNYCKEHQKQKEIYNYQLEVDNKRVKREQVQKNALLKEINSLQAAQNTSKKNLSNLYNYNILEAEYQNIFAVSSIYGYIKKGRTRSLIYQNGDQGAYNIYESERRLDKIITNTDEIITKLNETINYQYELTVGLRDANIKINSLYSNVTNHLNGLSDSLDSVKQCQSVISYNSQKAAEEAEFVKWMHVLKI